MWAHSWLRLAALAALHAASAQALAADRMRVFEGDGQTSRCVVDAAQYHGVNPWLLRAILKVESDFSARAVHRNANGTLDVGMAQINSVHFAELARWGVAPSSLMDGCIASYVAAW
jgi:soluble lytic murein transglycosylase-like protein